MSCGIHCMYMKTLTCKDLGGPCEKQISADTFVEIGNACQVHVMEEISKGDGPHRDSVEKWKKMTQTEMDTMLEEFEKKFNETPEE